MMWSMQDVRGPFTSIIILFGNLEIPLHFESLHDRISKSSGGRLLHTLKEQWTENLNCSSHSSQSRQQWRSHKDHGEWPRA